ncbi:hypothetical protein [Microbacterium hydrothermale]|uniref:hypothetical protein n=1 Tax=Microbacterium hydrothermale TaxID=857427 RepID=UPI0010A78393|nr:hypothetical protein [Microbacterium hydrothermale]
MEALVPVMVGGLIAAVGGLLGAAIQARRDHAKWLREKRLEAYVPLVAFLTEYEIILSSVADHQSRIDDVIPHASKEEVERLESALAPDAARGMEYRDRVPKELAAIAVLGPASLAEAARQWEEASRTTLVPWFKVGSALRPLIAQMRKALNIKT